MKLKVASSRGSGKIRELLHLPVAEWPQIDRDLWTRAFTVPNDLFGEFRNGHHQKPATKASSLYAYRRWLGWLARWHPKLLEKAPPDRLEPQIFRDYVAHLRQTNAERSVPSQIRFLYFTIRFMCPEGNWAWLKDMKARLERSVPKKGHQPILINSQRLYDGGCDVMDLADAKLSHPALLDSAKKRQAIALVYRDGLIVSVAALLILRRKNLGELFLGTTIIRREEVWTVDIPGENVKNDEQFLADLPPALGERIDRFLAIYRPLICRSELHSGLWASAKGTPASPGALYVAFRKTVRKYLRLPITLHDVRRIASTTWAIHDPVNVAGAKDLLGNRSDRVFNEHYNLASGIEASRVMAQLVRNLK